MKIIKLKNCLLFMTAINSIGSKWGIKEYKKLLDGEDMIKRLTLYIAIAYYKHVKYQCGTNFRNTLGRFVMDRPAAQHPYRGTSLKRSSPPRKGHHRALGMVLPQGPRGPLFLMSEVPL